MSVTAKRILDITYGEGTVQYEWKPGAERTHLHAVFKYHFPPLWLLREADVVLYSWRDVRDVVASLSRWNGRAMTVSEIQRYIAVGYIIMGGGVDYGMPFEAMTGDPEAATANILEAMGSPLEARDVAASVVQIEWLRNHRTSPDHPGDRSQADPATLAEIESQCGDWLRDHGY